MPGARGMQPELGSPATRGIHPAVNFSRFLLTLAGATALSLSAALGHEVYSGEPLAEALHDLPGTLIAHELTSASGLSRRDVFRLRDGRLLAITSRATEMGTPYGIKELRVTAKAGDKLTKRLPTVSAVTFAK